MATIKKFSLARHPARVAAAKAAVEPVEQCDPLIAAMDAASADLPRLLAPMAVAEMLGVTERTLERWRMNGEGPSYVKLSRSTVRYAVEEVVAFVNQRIRQNTAQ